MHRNLKFIVESRSTIFKNNVPDVFVTVSEIVTDALKGWPNKNKQIKNELQMLYIQVDFTTKWFLISRGQIINS